MNSPNPYAAPESGLTPALHGQRLPNEEMQRIQFEIRKTRRWVLGLGIPVILFGMCLSVAAVATFAMRTANFSSGDSNDQLMRLIFLRSGLLFTGLGLPGLCVGILIVIHFQKLGSALSDPSWNNLATAVASMRTTGIAILCTIVLAIMVFVALVLWSMFSLWQA